MKTTSRNYIIGGVLAMSLFTFQGTTVSAQKARKTDKQELKQENQKQKEDKNAAEKEIKDKSNPTSINKEKKDNVHAGNNVENKKEGNQCGKDKGDLKGKEPGQERPSQAKMSKGKPQNLNDAVTQGEKKIKEYRTKIYTSRGQLEKDKKARRISEAEYRIRKGKIDKAEVAVNDLEHKIQKAKK
jgi:colicin import membrane protein